MKTKVTLHYLTTLQPYNNNNNNNVLNLYHTMNPPSPSLSLIPFINGYIRLNIGKT